MRFHPGETVMRRYFRGRHVTWVQAARVLADDAAGLLLWVPVGAGFACRVDGAGRRLREAPLDVVRATRLDVREWTGLDILVLVPPKAAHSVWWFFADGAFRGWYVNLEAPSVRWERGGARGLDTTDHALDIVVSPDRTWRWKDAPEFAEWTGQPGFWTPAEAAAIRAEGERMAAVVETGGFPFDGSWCSFEPEPGWSLPALATVALEIARAVPSQPG